MAFTQMAWAAPSELQQCINASKKFKYISEIDEARLKCASKHPVKNAESCFALSNLFQAQDTADNFRWSCLQDFNKSITTKLCEKIADKIGNPSLQARAWYYCLEEIKASPIKSECLSLAKKLYPADTAEILKEFCQSEVN